jgi:hypothetical protein
VQTQGAASEVQQDRLSVNANVTKKITLLTLLIEEPAVVGALQLARLVDAALTQRSQPECVRKSETEQKKE